MTDINFFTPVHFGGQQKTWSQSLLEKVDLYFYHGGNIAHVTPESLHQKTQQVILAKHTTSWASTALKVVSYCTLILPALLLIAKTALRWNHRFQVIDATRYATYKLGEGLPFPEGQHRHIEELAPVLFQGQDHEEVIWHFRNSRNLIFQLRSHPDLIFKTAYGDSFHFAHYTENQFDNIVEAKKVCFTHELDHLVIPAAQQFTVSYRGHEVPVIAQKFIDTPYNPEQFFSSAPALVKSVQQMTRLIAETNLLDNQSHNFRVSDDGRLARLSFKGRRPAPDALFAPDFGFIRTLGSEAQVDAMIKEVMHEPYSTFSLLTNAHARQTAHLGEIDAMRKFYAANGVAENPLQPIQVDLPSLGLDLEERTTITTHWDEAQNPSESRETTMDEAVQTMIAKINAGIGRQEGHKKTSWEKRRIFILTSAFNYFVQLRYHNPLFASLRGLSGKKYDEERPKVERQTWPGRILDALQEQGSIFSWGYNDLGYSVQA